MAYYSYYNESQDYGTEFVDQRSLRAGFLNTKRTVAMVILVLCILVGSIGLVGSMIEESQRAEELKSAKPVEAVVSHVELAPNPYTGEKVQFSAFDLVYVSYDFGDEKYENIEYGKFEHKKYREGNTLDLLVSPRDHGVIIEQESEEAKKQHDQDRQVYVTILMAGGIPLIIFLLINKLLHILGI